MQDSYVSSFFRGGGCGASKSLSNYQQGNSQLIPLPIIQDFKYHFQKIKNATHPEQLMNTFQFFKIHERYLQYMINHKEQCIANKKIIFDQFVIMIDKIQYFLELKTVSSQQCAYYLSELNTKFCNILFVYYYFMEQNFIQKILQEKNVMSLVEHKALSKKIANLKAIVEEPDIELCYKNALQYELSITSQLIDFIPTEGQNKLKVLADIVQASVASFSKGIIDPSLLKALANGAQLLNEMRKRDKLEAKFKIIYSLNEIKWRIIEQIERCDSINITIQTLVDIYLKIKDIKDWNIMYTWIKVVGELYKYSPTIHKTMLEPQELFNYVNKKYLYQIGENYYQSYLTYEQLQQDECAFELLSKIQCQQHLAQLQHFILTGTDKFPSFENYYLTLDLNKKEDKSKDEDNFLELLFTSMKLKDATEFTKEIDKDIVELQQMIELTIIQANNQNSVKPHYTKIQFFLNSLLVKLFNFNLLEGYLENIQKILDFLFMDQDYNKQLNEDMEKNKNKDEEVNFTSNVLQVETGIMITEIIKGMYRFKKIMSEENGQTKTLQDEFLKQIQNRNLELDQQIVEFQLLVDSELKNSWKKLKDSKDNQLTIGQIIDIQKEIKSTILTQYDIKKVKNMKDFKNLFNKILQDFRQFYQIHLYNLSSLLKINYQIEQQIYQVEQYSLKVDSDKKQIPNYHQINIHIDLIWESKSLIKYNTWFLMFKDLRKLKSCFSSIRSKELKTIEQNSIYPNIQQYIIMQIIEKNKSTTQFKIKKFLQYFANEYLIIQQTLDNQELQELIKDYSSYFDLLRAIVYLITQCLSDYKTQLKQLTEYTKMLATAQEIKDQKDDGINEQDLEYQLMLRNLINDIKNYDKNTQDINFNLNNQDIILDNQDIILDNQDIKLNNQDINYTIKKELKKKDIQPILNKLQHYFEYQTNDNYQNESQKAILENVKKVQSLLEIINYLNFEDVTEYQGAKALFTQIQHIVKEYFDGKIEFKNKTFQSQPTSPRNRISYPIKQTKVQQTKVYEEESLLDLQNIKVNNLEKILFQILESFSNIKRKNNVFLKFYDNLSQANYTSMLKQRNFSSELKILQKLIRIDFDEIDSTTFVENYKNFKLANNQQKNIKFINRQLINSILNMFADKPQSRFEKYKQLACDFFNDNWRVRQIAVLELLSMKYKSINKPIYEQAARTILRFYAFETDSRVRTILDRPQESNFLNDLFSQYWQSEEEVILDKLKEYIKDLNNLGFELQSTGDMDQRKILQFQIQNKQKEIDEILKNVGSIGQALGITILFIQDLKQDLQRIQSKLNEMNETLQSIQADIRYLRGKTVQQLLEIRMNKVLQNQLILNYKSVYVQLQTKELIEGKEVIEDSHLYTNDIFGDGEVNEFLWKQDKESMLIHGQAGSGKSTAARKIEEFLWMFYKKNTNIKDETKLIPIMINLPSIKNVKENAIEEALKSDYYRFDNKQIQDLKDAVEEGKYRLVIIFDAYDELHQSIIGINLNFTNHVNRWRQSKDVGKYPKIITTSRSEIFNISYYSTWFMTDSKNADRAFKEVKLQKFNKGQVHEYLNQYTKLGIKKTLFEYYQPLVKINNEIDQLQQFEQLWGQMQIGEHNFAFQNNGSSSGITESEIQQILGIMKSDRNIEMFSQEVERSLVAELKMLWPTSVYLNCIDVMNLYDLLETPFMMEIVVQVLPIIIKKKSEPQQLQENFINNYVSLSKFELERDQALNKARDYWKLIQNSQQFFNQFQITLSTSRIQEILIKQFPSFSDESAIIAQALQNQELIQYDYYEYFFQMYFEKQIRKLQDNGQAYDYVVLINEIKQFSTELAIKMTLEQKTQIEYKSHGLFYNNNTQKEWTEYFFDDTEEKLGQVRKMYRSCLPLRQKSCFYSFNHKSLQEFLVAQDFCKFILSIENNKIPDTEKQLQDQQTLIEKQIEEQTINKTSFSNEFYLGISNFISQKFCKNQNSKNILIGIIKKTVKCKNLVMAGSNCFFFLSKMGAYLGGQDFTSIEIRNVDLSESNLFRAVLSNSKFDNVNISNINLNQAELNGVIWNNIKINALPNLDNEKISIQNIASVSEQNIIAITLYGQIKLYKMNQKPNDIILFDQKNYQVKFSEITSTHIFISFEDKSYYFFKLNLKENKVEQIQMNTIHQIEKFKQINQYSFIIVNEKGEMYIYDQKSQPNRFQSQPIRFPQGSSIRNIQCLFTSLQREEVCIIYLQQFTLFLKVFNSKETQIYSRSLKDFSNQQNELTSKFHTANCLGIYLPNTSKIAVYYQFEIQIYDINNQVQMEISISLPPKISNELTQNDYLKQLICNYDGTQLLTLKDKVIQVWDAKSLSKIGRAYKHTVQVEAIALLQKSSLILAGQSDGAIKLWDIQSSSLNQQLSEIENTEIQSSQFNKDASLLFIAIKRKIQIWNLISKVFLVKELKGHRGEIVCMNISPNQQKLAGGVKTEGAIYVWSISNCELKHKVQTFQLFPFDLQWFDDNFLASLEKITTISSNSGQKILKILDLKDRSMKVIGKQDESYDMYDTILSYNKLQQNIILKFTLKRTNKPALFLFYREKDLYEITDTSLKVDFNIFQTEKQQNQEQNKEIIFPESLNNSIYVFGRFKRVLVIHKESRLYCYHFKRDSTKKSLTIDQVNVDNFPDQIKCLKLSQSDKILFIGGKNIAKYKINQRNKKNKNNEEQEVQEKEFFKINEFKRPDNDQNNELISSIVVSANTEFLYGACENGIIYKWNYRTQKIVNHKIKTQDNLLALHFSHHLVILICVSEKAIQFWTQQDKQLEPENTIDNFDNTYQNFGYSVLPYNTSILAVAAINIQEKSNAIILIDIERRQKIDEIKDFKEIPRYFCFLSSQLTIIIKTFDQHYELKQYPLSILYQLLTKQKNEQTCLNVSCINVFKDYIALSYDTGKISYENKQTSESRLKKSVDSQFEIQCLAHSKDGQMLFSGNQKNINIWKVENKQVISAFATISAETSINKNIISELVPFDNKILIVKRKQGDPEYFQIPEKAQITEKVQIPINGQFIPLICDLKKINCISTDEDSIIILYDYLLLKRWRTKTQKNNESFLCSQTYGEKQGIECENVECRQSSIKSYLGIDLTKLFKK